MHFKITGDDVTVENVVGKDCSKGISISGSGAWVGNSSFIDNDSNGVEIWEGTSSTTSVTIYKNNISSNGKHGILILKMMRLLSQILFEIILLME